MKKIKTPVITALLLAATVFSVTVCGQRSNGSEQRSQQIMGRISKSLDLTKAQQEKLKAINEVIQSGLNKYRNQQHQLIESVIEDVQEPTMDKKLLMQVVASRQQAYDDIAPQVVDKVMDFQASLSAAQKRKLAYYLQYWSDEAGTY